MNELVVVLIAADLFDCFPLRGLHVHVVHQIGYVRELREQFQTGLRIEDMTDRLQRFGQ